MWLFYMIAFDFISVNATLLSAINRKFNANCVYESRIQLENCHCRCRWRKMFRNHEKPHQIDNLLNWLCLWLLWWWHFKKRNMKTERQKAMTTITTMIMMVVVVMVVVVTPLSRSKLLATHKRTKNRRYTELRHSNRFFSIKVKHK